MDLLGRMLLITIREDVSIEVNQFTKKWKSCNLPDEFLPKARSVEDAFRVATPRKKWKNGLALLDYNGGQHMDKGRLETILVYSEDSTKKVDINHVNRAVLYLNGNDINMEPYTPLLVSEVQYIEEIKDAFHYARVHIDGTQFRNAIMKCLQSIYVIPYKDGSYLVSSTYFNMADNISKMIQLVNLEGSSNVLWDIPYVDNISTRDQLKDALNKHIVKVGDTTLFESMVSKSKINTQKIRKKSRARTLLQTIEDLNKYVILYESLLKEDLGYLKETIRSYYAMIQSNLI